MRRASPERRAGRLVRWYPKAWRRRYGEEFTELLVDDIAERPRSWHRTLDVVRSGLAAQMSQRQLTRPRLASSAVIFGAGLAGAAVLRVLVDPNEQIKCPRFIRHPLGASCLIVTGHGWVNPAALGIVLLGLATALGVLLNALLRPSQRRIVGAVAILAGGAAVAVWVVAYRVAVPTAGIFGGVYRSTAPVFYPSTAWTVADAALIGVAVVGAALAVLHPPRQVTRLRLAGVVLLLAAILAGAAIPHAVRDPGGVFSCDVRLPPGYSGRCPYILGSGRELVDPTVLALCGLAAAGATCLLLTARRRRS
jgi:hypothetical protein